MLSLIRKLLHFALLPLFSTWATVFWQLIFAFKLNLVIKCIGENTRVCWLTWYFRQHHGSSFHLTLNHNSTFLAFLLVTFIAGWSEICCEYADNLKWLRNDLYRHIYLALKFMTCVSCNLWKEGKEFVFYLVKYDIFPFWTIKLRRPEQKQLSEKALRLTLKN